MPPPVRRRGGARVGGRKGDVYRIGGVDIAWDPELPSEHDKARPMPTFPSYRIEKPKPVSEKERRQVQLWKNFRDSFRNGPLFTELKNSNRSGNSSKAAAATFDAFNELRFFPRELWSTLDPGSKAPEGEADANSARLKELRHSKIDAAGKDGVNEHYASDEEGHDRSGQDDDDQEGLVDEDLDDAYDDEDDGGDYDAEQYFDDGDGDGMDDFDGGDEGGVDYF